MSESNQTSEKKENQAETADKLQERDAPVKEGKEGEETKTQKAKKERKISKLLEDDGTKKSTDKESNKESKKEKKIAELNKENAAKRFKLDELNKTLKSKEEREAQLIKEIETLKLKGSEKEKLSSEKEKELETLKTELANFKEQRKNIEDKVMKREEERKAELVKQAEMVSKKQKDPDILILVENATNNEMRELILNKLKPRKVDTIKVTELSNLSSVQKTNVNPLYSSLSEISQLRDDDPEAYEDIIAKADNMKWKK
jgi:chromosome segregation ATPase